MYDLVAIDIKIL